MVVGVGIVAALRPAARQAACAGFAAYEAAQRKVGMRSLSRRRVWSAPIAPLAPGRTRAARWDFHRWYEARGPQRCLITMVDDATSCSDGRFSGEETMWAAAAVLRRRIEQHGVPLALSTDWKTVYVRAATELEHAVGHVPLTQFGRMCAASAITGRTRIAS